MSVKFSFSAEDEQFREEVRSFLASALTQGLIDANRQNSGMFVDRATAQKWQEKLNAKGWGAVHWPKV